MNYFILLCLFSCSQIFGSVKILQGNYTVGDDGALNFELPLNFPSGVNNSSPNMSFVYNSNNNHVGILGKSWTLTGLSSISRCPQTMIQDGKRRQVKIDKNDKYCLDGQKLVLTKGIYGEGNSQYSLERDPTVKIVLADDSYLNSLYFTVYKKNGDILYYGNSKDSILQSKRSSESIITWYFNKTIDRNSNYISFKYFKGVDHTSPTIKEITYSGNTKTELTPFNRIIFTYKDKINKSYKYFSGEKVVVSKLVSNIEILSYGTKISDYNLNYKKDQLNREILIDVTQCNKSQQCSKPIIFKWSSQGSNKFGEEIRDRKNELAGSYWKSDDLDRHMIDLNGDGFTDILGYGDQKVLAVFGSKNGFSKSIDMKANEFAKGNWKNNHNQLRHIIDYNGDGIADLLGISDIGLLLSIGTGSSFHPTKIISKEISKNQLSHIDDLCKITDINGDSLPDLIIYGKNGTYIAKNINGNSISTLSKISDQFSYNTGWSNKFSYRDIVDLNGDGLADLVGSSQSGLFVAYNEGKTFSKIRKIAEKLGGIRWDNRDSYRAFKDMNGDGLFDFVGIDNNGMLLVSINNGKEFEKYKIWKKVVPFDLTKQFVQLVDVNDDNLPDIIGFGPTDIFVSLNKGTVINSDIRFSEFKSWKSGFGTNRWIKTKSPVQFTDIDGDGTLDLVALGDSFAAYLKSDKNPMVIQAIEDGFDNKTFFKYDFLTNNSIYKKNRNSHYPLMDYQGATQVVSSVESSNGIGGFNKVSFNYEGMKIHRNGWGSLGFKSKKATDHSNGIAVTVNYNQDYKNLLAGTLLSTISKSANGTVIDRKQNKFKANKKPGKVLNYTLELVSTINEKFELDGELISKTEIYNTYDKFLNPLSINTTISNDSETVSKTVTNTYRNDEDNWILGRLTVANSANKYNLNPEESKKSKFTYDKNGLLACEIIEPDSKFERKTCHNRNELGLIISSINSWPKSESINIEFNSIEQKQIYDKYGRLIKEINPLGHTGSFTYRAEDGLLLKTTDLNGRTVANTYDDWLDVIKTTDYLGITKTSEQFWCDNDSDCPNLAKYYSVSKEEGSYPVYQYFDSLGRVIQTKTTDFNDKTIYSTNIFNDKEQLYKSSRSYYAGEKKYWTVNYYDELERIKKIIFPDKSESTISYQGSKKISSNGKGQKSIEITNLFGKKSEVIDDKNTSVKYSYDSSGRLIKTTLPSVNSKKHFISFKYNKLDKKIQMYDPSKGTHKYYYNGMGLLYKHVKNDIASNEKYFDPLGRVIKEVKNGKDNNNTFTYKFDSVSHGLGKLFSVSNDYYYQENKFDQHSRLVSVIKSIDGEKEEKKLTYDSLGRISTLKYPENITLKNSYAKNGSLKSIIDLENKKEIWSLAENSITGKITAETLGNSNRIYYSYDLLDDSINNIKVASSSNKFISDNTYDFDVLGNLILRQDNLRNYTQNFTYDSLNRLLTFQDSANQAATVTYGPMGNIRNKSDVGNYTYGKSCSGSSTVPGPNAVTRVESVKKTHNYCYDINGNQISGPDRKITYTSFDKPSKIESLQNKVEFIYGPRDEKILRIDAGLVSEDEKTTKYFGKDLEKIKSKKGIVYKIYVGGKAIITKVSGKPKNIDYLVKDHIGSLIAVVDEKENVKERFYYDPWGKKIEIKDTDFLWNENLKPKISTNYTTDRGFTGHEHIESFELIHMGGRVYDQVTGRFVSADPYVNGSGTAQSFNRYSYVENNPLTYTDPSGYFLHKSLKRASNWVNKNKRSVVTITVLVAATYFTGGVAAGTLNGYLLASAKGAVASYIGSGGDLRATAKGALVGAIFHGVGDSFEGLEKIGKAKYISSKVVAHGMVGGISSVADGGKFETGFVSAAVSQASGHLEAEYLGDIKALESAAAQATIGAVIGGTTSQMMGGNFENGAITTAYGRLLNDFMHYRVDNYGSVIEDTFGGEPGDCHGPNGPTLLSSRLVFEAGIKHDDFGEIALTFGASAAFRGVGIGLAAIRSGSSSYSSYKGVREASAYLRAQGVPRHIRKSVLESFEKQTISVKQAGKSQYGMRYHDNGINANAKGRYLFNSFPASRGSLAIKSNWNKMSGIKQWKVQEGATIIKGRAASQGIGLGGGQTQMFINNLDNLVAP